jgi:hypothetical protein
MCCCQCALAVALAEANERRRAQPIEAADRPTPPMQRRQAPARWRPAYLCGWLMLPPRRGEPAVLRPNGAQ